MDHNLFFHSFVDLGFRIPSVAKMVKVAYNKEKSMEGTEVSTMKY